MHEDRSHSDSGSGAEGSPTEKEDSTWQARVLSLLLAEHPHQLTKLELARLVLGENPGFAERDAFEQAVEDLVRAGLLQRCNTLVMVTQAARHFASLPMP